MDKVVWQKHQGVSLGCVNDYNVIDCEACGFRHIVPIPSDEQLAVIYREEYYSKDKPDYFESSRRDFDWWRMVYRERYQTFESLLPEDHRRVIDVGSGPGFFLLEGKERGWQPQGIEPSRQAAEHARDLGIPVVNDFLSSTTMGQLPPSHVIHLSNVMEHIPNPIELLRICHRLLLDNGLLAVVVPNDFNPFQQALLDACDFQPWWISPPHHINYFDFDSLQGLLERSGFEIVLRESTFPIDLFLLMGDNYVGNDSVGRACHERRMRFEFNLETAGLSGVKRSLYQAMAQNNIGREIFFVARKVRLADE